MIESTTDISSEINIMEAKLKENGSICRSLELINEASKCPKTKISNFQSVVCENRSKLEINHLHVLTQYVSG